MTKSTITRERAEQLANFKGAPVTRQEEQELARMALAEMDSEPVAEVCEDYAIRYISNGPAPKEGLRPGDKLYRHAQPVPVVSADLLHTAASAIEDLLTTKDRTGAGVWFDLPFRLRSAANAQPEPVVPDEVTAEDCPALVKYDVTEADEAWARGFNACRAAMLQAEPVTTANKFGNSPVIPDGSAAILRRWLAFGCGMKNIGIQLPRNLLAETEVMLAATMQEVNRG